MHSCSLNIRIQLYCILYYMRSVDECSSMKILLGSEYIRKYLGILCILYVTEDILTFILEKIVIGS